jgi:hypothetical protein
MPDWPQFEPPEQRVIYVVPAEPRADDEDRARRRLLRRLKILLVTGVTAFVLTTWMLVSVPNPAALFGAWGNGPESLVQSYFEALNRGELRTAYGMFSTKFRGEVTFEAYHALVISHRRMFLTRQFQVRDARASAERTVLLTRLETTDGEHYLAQFTLVRLDGRWWIHDLRWAAEPAERQLITI